MPIRAVLFDLDGVLVNACDWHYEALNSALLEVVGFSISPEEHAAAFNGLPTKIKLRKLLDEGRIKAGDRQKIENIKQMYFIRRIEHLTEDEDKIYLLTQLRDCGFLLGCVTNSIRRTAEIMLKKTGQLPFFSALITNEDIRNPKPAPDGYLLAMKHLQVKPEETLIVEDSLVGLEAAHASGAKVLAVKDASEVLWERLRQEIQ